MRRLSLFLLLFIVFTSAKSTDINSGIPSFLETENQTLILNGSGIREKFFINLFTGGLYLKEKCNDPVKIINSDELMTIKIKVTSDKITGKRLEEAMRSEFDRVTKGNTHTYKGRIDHLVKTFKQDVKIGDTYDLTYHPGGGLKIFKNDKLQSEILGLDFKKVLFSIWLGDDPMDKNLKNGMLG